MAASGERTVFFLSCWNKSPVPALGFGDCRFSGKAFFRGISTMLSKFDGFDYSLYVGGCLAIALMAFFV